MGRIVWIASYPKSGNTWVRLFLMELLHPGAALDPKMVQQFAPNENAAAFYRPFSVSPLTSLSNGDLARIRPQAQNLAASQKPFVLLKTHNLRGTHLGTPTLSSGLTAAAVYIVRNPLDVVVSCAFFRNLTMDGAIDRLLEKGRILPRAPGGSYMISRSWSENVRSWKAQPGELVLTLRYEDCLGAPQSSFCRLATFLRLPVTPEAVDTAIERTSFSALADAERRGGFNERPASTDRFFRSGVAGQWQNHLTSAHINRVPQHCAPEMALHGYTI